MWVKTIERGNKRCERREAVVVFVVVVFKSQFEFE